MSDDRQRRWIVEAYACVFDTPTLRPLAEVRRGSLGGSSAVCIIRPGALDSIDASRLGVRFNHGLAARWWEGRTRQTLQITHPIGVPLAVWSDERGLRAQVMLARTAAAAKVLDLIERGIVTAFSFEGLPIRSRYIPLPRVAKIADRPILEWSEFAVTEIGPALPPACQQARILSVEFADVAPPPSLLGLEQQERREERREAAV